MDGLRGVLIGAASAAALATGAMAQVDYPVPGRPITILIPFAPGGPSDVGARILIPLLEKELGPGTVFQVVNKPGATTQIANTELARARPDGHTIAVVPPPSLSVTYLDPERKAAYGRKDFTPIAHFTSEANLLIVPAGSPSRTTKDLIEAARARPKQIRVGTAGLMGNTHLAGIMLEESTGVKFAFVHFNGAAPLAAALLGNNVDAGINGILATVQHERAGTMRVLGTMDKKRTKYFPDAAPLLDQGYDVYSPTSFAFYGPANIPRPIVDKLSAAIKRAMEHDEFKRRIDEVTLVPDYLDPEGTDAFWTETENRMRKLLEMAKSRQE